MRCKEIVANNEVMGGMVQKKSGCLAMLLLPLLVSGQAHGIEIFGWSEPVSLPGAGISMVAKLDTGADTSSLDATNIRMVRRGDKRLVRFNVRNPESGEEISLVRPFIRSTRIRRHFGAYQTRRVVSLQICLGEVTQTIEVNLIDRSNFSYPMLLGRNALEGVALVDSSRTNTSKPNCPDTPKE